MNKFQFIFLILFSFLASFSYGQKYVSDSAILHLQQHPSVQNKGFQIYNFIDKRRGPSQILTIGETKKYGVIPVDYFYLFEKNLDALLDSLFNSSMDSCTSPCYQLEIEYFKPQLIKGGFVSQYQLQACISIYSLNKGVSVPVGKLLYEEKLPYKTVKKDVVKGYERLIYNWQGNFIRDMNTFMLTPEAARGFILPNYKGSGFTYERQLMATMFYMAGKAWYGIESELFFTSPECRNAFIRNTGTIRYVNHKNVETLFLGRKNENMFLRQGPASMVVLQPKFYLGLNRWKDNDMVEHGLEELLQACFSFSQMYQYNRLDKRGLFFSLGFTEDAFYIYNKLDFRFGMKAGFVLKL